MNPRAIRLTSLSVAVALFLIIGVGCTSHPTLTIPASAVTATLGDRRVALSVGALTAGQRRIEVWNTDQHGRSLDDVQQVQLRFSMPFICADVIDLTLDRMTGGHFQRQGAFFGMAGSWVADLTLQTTAGQTYQTRLVAVVDQPDVVNPFAAGNLPDAAWLTQGRQLYVTHCAACHGMNGHGDGPRSATLNPRPTDLTAHMVAGKHTDEQTYLTISNGRTNTAMPAWGGTLREQEIWQLTAYIRTFAQQTDAQPAPLPAAAPQP